MNEKINQTIEKYYNMVYRVALNRMHSDVQAQDISQEVFLRYLKHKDELENEEHIKNWLLRVAVNCCNKFYNSAWVRNGLYFNDIISQDGIVNSTMFTTYDTYNIESDILETVKSLPEQYSSMIRLFYFEDLSVQEISLYTGLNENTVKTKLRRARLLLKECMKSKNDVPNTAFSFLQEEIQKYFEYYSRVNGISSVKRSYGIEQRAAIISIDLANMWTRPGSPFSCNADEAVKNASAICNAARNSQSDIPIIHCITDFSNMKKSVSTIKNKMPVNLIDPLEKEYLYQLDSRLHVKDSDYILWKNCIGCFKSTMLNNMLKSQDIDTLIIMGVTASAAVRLTVMDAYILGYNIIVPSDAIADRIVGAREWNLFDIELNFGEVANTKQVIKYIKGIEPVSKII